MQASCIFTSFKDNKEQDILYSDIGRLWRSLHDSTELKEMKWLREVIVNSKILNFLDNVQLHYLTF